MGVMIWNRLFNSVEDEIALFREEMKLSVKDSVHREEVLINGNS